MTDWHLKSKRKSTGGIRKSKNRCDKKLAWIGGTSAKTLVSKDDDRKTGKGRSSVSKSKLFKAVTAVVSEGEKTTKAKILGVKRNIANRHFERRQVITKGAVIEVELNGERKQALVTSRPGQNGEVQAKLVPNIIEVPKKKSSKKKVKQPKKQPKKAKKTPKKPVSEPKK